MLYCSLLYLHQAPAWVLRFASKPSPASGDTIVLLSPVTTAGRQMFPLCFGVRPGNNCSTTWQLLKPDRWRQAQTALETLHCPVSAKPLAFRRHWQESYLLCYFIYRNKIKLKLSEIMSICLVFSVWENCVGQHYQMHSKQTDWSHSCRSET